MKNQSKFSKNNILIAIRSRPLSNLELETSSEKTITIKNQYLHLISLLIQIHHKKKYMKIQQSL